MSNLIIFNYEMNQDSKALAFCIDWVNAIAKNFDKVFVITLRKGKFIVDSNVEVFSLDSDRTDRIIQILKLYKILFKLHKTHKIDGYFVHMAHKFVPFIYPFAKYYNQKIVLWYAHKSIPMSLKISEKLVDRIFSISFQSMRLQTDKFKPIGHGIDTANRFILKDSFSKKIKNIITVGRISKVKNTDLIVKSFLSLNKDDIFLYIAGDVVSNEDKIYLQEIKKLIPKEKEKNIIFLGNVSFDELPKFMQKIDLAVNLGDGALDKAILEPMAMGIPIITSNDSAKELFGYLDNKGVYLIDKNNLEDKLKELVDNELKYNPKELREEVVKNHSLDRLAKIISKEFIND